MTKRFLHSLVVFSLFFSTAFAQESDFTSLGNFGNLRTIIDPQTKKERPMTDQEVKQKAVQAMKKKLEDLRSVRVIDEKNIRISPSSVAVPLVENGGSPFYTVIIDRATGLTGQELYLKPTNDRAAYEKSRWDEGAAAMEKRRDAAAEKIKAYRQKHPSQSEPFKVKFPDEVYKPKAPARKITPK